MNANASMPKMPRLRFGSLVVIGKNLSNQIPGADANKLNIKRPTAATQEKYHLRGNGTRVESRGIRATPRDSFAKLRKRRSFSWNRENIYDSTTRSKTRIPAVTNMTSKAINI